MYIVIGKQIGTCQKKKAMIKTYRKSPGNFDNAAHAAWHYAKKYNCVMLAFRGNNRGTPVYHLVGTTVAKDCSYYTCQTKDTYTSGGLVLPDGSVFQVYFSDYAGVDTPAGKTILSIK